MIKFIIMNKSILSDIAKIEKITKIWQKLSSICGGEVVRMAIIGITKEYYVVSYSYKIRR